MYVYSVEYESNGDLFYHHVVGKDQNDFHNYRSGEKFSQFLNSLKDNGGNLTDTLYIWKVNGDTPEQIFQTDGFDITDVTFSPPPERLFLKQQGKNITLFKM